MDPVTRDVAALEAWSAVLTKARAELPDTTIVMWFTDVEPVAFHNEVLSLSVPSALVRERLQHNHLALIEDAAADISGQPVKIECLVDEAMRHPLGDVPEPVAAPAIAAAPSPAAASPTASRRGGSCEWACSCSSSR